MLSSAGGATPNTEVDGSAVYLNFFSLQGVDAASPDAFAPTRAQRTLGSFTSAPASFCPEAVQTSRTGRYVVVFNASRCGSAASLDLFDTQTNRALPRLTGGTFGLVDAPPYLDQQADTLYYLQQKVSTADLIAVRLTDVGNGADVDFPATTLATLPDRDQRGLTQVGTTLLALYPSSFLSVPIATPTQNVLVDTLSDSRRFIDNLSPVRNVGPHPGRQPLDRPQVARRRGRAKHASYRDKRDVRPLGALRLPGERPANHPLRPAALRRRLLRVAADL